MKNSNPPSPKSPTENELPSIELHTNLASRVLTTVGWLHFRKFFG